MSERSIAQLAKSPVPAISQAPAALQRQCACGQHALGGECDGCGRKHSLLQRHASERSVPSMAPPIVSETLQSTGKKLDTESRTLFESRFGQDFSRVRVHTSSKAVQSALAVGANAYTVGHDVVFGEGQYAPTTHKGKSLLAHELTHVIQQSKAPAPANLPVRIVDDVAAEGEANLFSQLAGKLPAVAHEARGIQREPTQPRAATGAQSIDDVNQQTAKLPSTGVTAGSLSRQEWESLFKRHFTEPDKVEDEVESAQSRYLFSSIYGWIDAQHFFAHIQFAEDSGVTTATAEGIGIETKQQMVRGAISASVDDNDIFGEMLTHNLINADDFMHYRETLFIAMAIAMDHFLSKQQADLVKGFSDEQVAKLILDNANSAWSYEDLVSNQLGVQFFQLYGSYVNAGADPAAVRSRFIDKMTEYFGAIQVINDPAEVKRRAKGLPGKERWTAPKLNEAQARAKFPELFEFDRATHHVRISVYDLEKEAQKGKEAVEKSVSARLPVGMSLTIVPFGSQFALVTGAMSHFEAVVYKSLIDKAVRTGAGGALIEPVAGVKTK